MRKTLKNKGFTLVELIIVIAILAIIMLIAIPNFSGIQQRMQVRADKATAAQIGKAVRIWYTEYNSDPSFKALVGATYKTGANVNTVKSKAEKSMPAGLADTTAFVEGLPKGTAAMVHLCQVPELISYVDTTLVPKSLIDATTSASIEKQYFYVGMAGTGTAEKVVIAIAGEDAPTLTGALTQDSVLYNGVQSTTFTNQVAYLEP